MMRASGKDHDVGIRLDVQFDGLAPKRVVPGIGHDDNAGHEAALIGDVLRKGVQSGFTRCRAVLRRLAQRRNGNRRQVVQATRAPLAGGQFHPIQKDGQFAPHRVLRLVGGDNGAPQLFLAPENQRVSLGGLHQTLRRGILAHQFVVLSVKLILFDDQFQDALVGLQPLPRWRFDTVFALGRRRAGPREPRSCACVSSARVLPRPVWAAASCVCAPASAACRCANAAWLWVNVFFALTEIGGDQAQRLLRLLRLCLRCDGPKAVRLRLLLVGEIAPRQCLVLLFQQPLFGNQLRALQQGGLDGIVQKQKQQQRADGNGRRRTAPSRAWPCAGGAGQTTSAAFCRYSCPAGRPDRRSRRP